MYIIEILLRCERLFSPRSFSTFVLKTRIKCGRLLNKRLAVRYASSGWFLLGNHRPESPSNLRVQIYNVDHTPGGALTRFTRFVWCLSKLLPPLGARKFHLILRISEGRLALTKRILISLENLGASSGSSVVWHVFSVQHFRSKTRVVWLASGQRAEYSFGGVGIRCRLEPDRLSRRWRRIWFVG